MAKYRITQKMTLEYGRFSALPHHLPTRTISVEQVYVHDQVPYAITGSAFQTIDPETNAPPTSDRCEFAERCYVTFGDFAVEEITD